MCTRTHARTSISLDITGMKASIMQHGGQSAVSAAPCSEMMRNKSAKHAAVYLILLKQLNHWKPVRRNRSVSHEPLVKDDSLVIELY